MKSRTRIRPALLNPDLARAQLARFRTDQADAVVDVPEFTRIIDGIGQLRDMHDGLQATIDNPDPLVTPEAAALAFRQKYNAAVAKAQAIFGTMAGQIAAREERVLQDAYAKAGLNRDPRDPELAEIRTALRTMDDASRAKTISDAIERRDGAVIAALQNVSPVLYGSTTLPIQQMTRLYLSKHAPDLESDLEQLATALQTSTLAADAFKAAIESMRDPVAEQRAISGNAAAKKAEAAFGTALMDRPQA